MYLEQVTKKVPVDILYLDFDKAFDNVPHRRLLLKPKIHSITGCILNWIEDWLSNRIQRVTIGEIYSDWREVTSGVQQATVLGAILFLIYINDIDNNITSSFLKFVCRLYKVDKRNSRQSENFATAE